MTEIDPRYAQLRPTVSSSQVQAVRNDLLRAERELDRAAERSRRCAEYERTSRRPEHHGYSVGCSQESQALSSARSLVEQRRASHAQLADAMLEQRRATYAADVEPTDRSAPIRYARGSSGAYVPVRDPAPLARAQGAQPALAPPRPQPARTPWLLWVGGALVVGGVLYLGLRS